MIEAEARVTGPLFDGRARAALDDFAEAAEEALAKEGVNKVRQVLATSLRNSTGFYESQIRADTVRGDHVVDDSGVVYGPWLEGVTSANQSTGFPGYQQFRRATQQLQARAAQIAERVLPPFLARMNR